MEVFGRPFGYGGTEDQPSVERDGVLALTPLWADVKELDRVTTLGNCRWSPRFARGVCSYMTLGCCTTLSCFRAFALGIQALTAGGFSRLVGCLLIHFL